MAIDAASIECFRRHGGRIDAARALFPDVPDDWIDLSTGISLRAYPIMAKSGAAHRLLPSPADLATLQRAAAASFGVPDPEAVVAVPGSDLALRLLASLLGGRRVAVVMPGYGGHCAAWDANLVSPISAERIEAAAEDHDVLLLANPNNPDGRRLAPATLLATAGRFARRSGWLIVDEAFADARPEDSLACEPRENLILLRSFGKFFGLPGIRLGFVIAPPSIRDPLRRLIGDWPVSTAALHIATRAYRDIAWQVHQRRHLARQAARLDRLLIAAGLEVIGGTALFRLTRHAHAERLFVRLAAAGILTRPFAPDSGLLRFGLPNGGRQWARLRKALGAAAAG
jgi:cobalamin biosynthetic protein CobC